jgi:hypothetical protein
MTGTRRKGAGPATGVSHLVGQTDEKETRIEPAVAAKTLKAQSFWTSPWLHIAALVLVVAVTFGRTLGNYFLADDFCEIAYVSRIFDGDSGLFWSNFTGNYMQIPGMNVYRPWLMCSLVNDWLFYHAQAWGYYLTNLIYFSGVVSLLYVVVRQLTASWGPVRSSATALLSSLLFAAYPLHCESISWVVGRVDITAACFYLLGFSCFLAHLKKPSKRFQIFGVIAFVFALGTKEMAVGLPVLVAAVAFLWGDGNSLSRHQAGSDHRAGSDQPAGSDQQASSNQQAGSDRQAGSNQQAGSDRQSRPNRQTNSNSLGGIPAFNFWHRLKYAVVTSLPLWITLVCYFVVRLLCLKTLVGGYVAGFGASQLSEMVHHWFDPDTIRRILIPLNNELYGANPLYAALIATTEIVIATVAFVRILSGHASWRWFIFLAAWCATAAVPIFQLWGLGYNLEGARFYFFLSLPLSIIIPVFLFHPSPNLGANQGEVSQALAKNTQSWMNIENALYLTGSIATLALLVLLQKATVQTNMLWVHAGKEVRKLSEACQTLITNHPGQTRFLILGIPKDHAGAHMILNGTTFDIMMRPPFAKSDYAERLLNCDAVMYSPEQYVNGSQLRWTLAHKDVSGPYVWSREKQALLSFNYDAQGRAREGKSPPPITLGLAGLPPKWQPHTNGHAVAEARKGTDAKDLAVVFHSIAAGDGPVFDLGNTNPLDYQFLQFELKVDSDNPVRGTARGSVQGSVDWTGSDEASASANSNQSATDASQLTSAPYSLDGASRAGQFEVVTINLGHYWRWYTQGKIRSVHISLPLSKACTVRNVRLLPAAFCAPALSTEATNVGKDNPFAATAKISPVVLHLAPSAVFGAQSVALEIGRQDYFFDNFQNGAKVNAVAKTNVYPVTTATIPLDATVGHAPFTGPGFYQIRAQYLDAKGQNLGACSDPVTLNLSR